MWYRKGAELNPRDADLQFWTGLALLKLGRNEEAVGFLERALAIDPDADAARHFLNAARGQASETAPRAYVTNLFDEYASSSKKCWSANSVTAHR